MYTDGLIERRDEDIDASLARLTTALAKRASRNRVLGWGFRTGVLFR